MKLKVIAGAAAVTLVAGVIAVPSSQGQTSRRVLVKDNVFSPKKLTVRRNTTVRWVWRGKNPHNVTVTRGPVRFKSKPALTKGTYSRKLTRAGTYRIVCTIHATGMRMTLTVR